MRVATLRRIAMTIRAIIGAISFHLIASGQSLRCSSSRSSRIPIGYTCFFLCLEKGNQKAVSEEWSEEWLRNGRPEEWLMNGVFVCVIICLCLVVACASFIKTVTKLGVFFKAWDVHRAYSFDRRAK